MAKLRLAPYNYLDDASLVDTPAMVATMPVTNVQLVAHDKLARSTSIADQVIKGNYGGNGRRANCLFMFGHNAHGGNLRLELLSYADYSGAAAYDSGVLPVFPLVTLDLQEGFSPLGVSSSDLLALESPYYLFFPDTTHSSFRLTFTGCQNSYWQFDRIFLGRYTEAPFNPKYGGLQVGWQSNDVQQRSKGKTLRTRVGSRWRELRADMFYLTDADRAAWRDLMGRISKSEDFALSVFPGVGGRQERDHVFNMQQTDHSPFSWNSVNFNETVFTFAEV